jgi:hypothetical protein
VRVTKKYLEDHPEARARYLRNGNRSNLARYRNEPEFREKKKAIARAYKVKIGKEAVAEENRRQLLKREYGLTLEDYDRMVAAQGGVCRLCGKPPKTPKRPLAVDHDHKTGKVRGILCIGCNRAVATLGDTVEGLMRAVRYLRGEPLDG